MKPSSVVYWLRLAMAVVAGAANHFLGISEVAYGDLALPVAIALGAAFYFSSIFIVRNLLRYSDLELKGKNKYVTLGGGTFIVLWIMVAVLLNTLLA
jgi:hypothetical protein